MSRRFLPVLGLLVLAPALAFADGPEKVFVLKNGRRIRGELVSQSSSGYAVKTEGGTLTLDRSVVDHVEDPPPPPAHVLEPDAPKEPAPTPVEPRAPRPDPVPAPAREAPQPAPSDSSMPDTGPCIPAGLLASREEIAAARKALLAIVPLDPNDPGSAAAHQGSLEDTGKKISLAAVVTILSEPLNVAHPVPSPEQQVGLELIVARKTDPALRPILARAIGNIALEKCSPRVLFDAIGRVRDDDTGVLEQALLEKVHEAVIRHVAPDLFSSVLGQNGIGSRRSLPKLYEYLLAANADSAPAIAETCRLILTGEQNADTALAELANKIDVSHLPDYAHLASVIGLLGISSGQQVFKVSGILEALESAPPPVDNAGYKTCLYRAYSALGYMGTYQAEQRLVQSFGAARTPELRIVIAEQLGHMKQDDGAAKEATTFLVDQLDRPERTDRELSTIAESLSRLTGKSLGASADAWRDYLQQNR